FEQRLRQLQELRRTCLRRAAELGVLARQAADFCVANAHSIRSAAGTRLAAASASLREVQFATERPRADWPQAQARLEEAAQAYAAAQREAENDVQLYNKLH